MVRHADESEEDHEIRLWWLEHDRIGAFGYGPLARRYGANMPDLWFPDEDPPWTETIKREWLERARKFMALLKAAMDESSTD
jgi:hypothetical protein